MFAFFAFFFAFFSAFFAFFLAFLPPRFFAFFSFFFAFLTPFFALRALLSAFSQAALSTTNFWIRLLPTSRT